MRFSAGQLPNQPGINVAEQQFALFRLRPGALDVIENPNNLGSREIGVIDKTGLLANLVNITSLIPALNDLRRLTGLPNNSVVNRLACSLIPDNRGFALVGNADRADLIRCSSGFRNRLAGYIDLRCKNLLCVVLYPAGLRKNLGEFSGIITTDLSLLIEQNCADPVVPSSSAIT